MSCRLYYLILAAGMNEEQLAALPGLPVPGYSSTMEPTTSQVLNVPTQSLAGPTAEHPADHVRIVCRQHIGHLRGETAHRRAPHPGRGRRHLARADGHESR